MLSPSVAPSITPALRRLWALDAFAYATRVFIALATLMALCWQLDRMPLVVPLFLGTVACALAETDDNWRGRLQTLLLTLVCFAVAAFSVQALFAYKLLFVAGLALAAFGLTLLGAISRRYQAIGYGTLILSIYATIAMDQRSSHVQPVWFEPALLLGGAAWYGLLSVLWCALFVHQPVQQALAEAFRELGAYLRLKATMFEPVIDLPLEERRIALAQQSGRVVLALNNAKESIFNRIDSRRASERMRQYLRLYFIAQDVHDRAASSHYPYDRLTDAFFHSDVLFRCQRLMHLHGEDCRRLARAILLRVPFERRGDSAQARRDLDSSLDYLRRQDRPQWAGLLDSLGALARNLGAIDGQLRAAREPGQQPTEHDGALFDRSPHSVREALGRVRRHLNTGSPLFRHGLRLAAALVAGYALMHVIHARQGYWILLTTVFVCQPSFGATRKRMVQRIAGTLLGLVLGWALFDLFPSLLLQSMFAVVAGVVFFIMRTRRYTLATASMTLVVLMCFNQIGDGYGLIVPRMIDTLLGALMAGLAVFLVLPDWQGRRLHELAARSLAALASYLRAIMAQYGQGARDDLAYRLARRNAHNADAALSGALSNMMQEPHFLQREGDAGLRLLLDSHTLLNYLSGLGAHRAQLAPGGAGPTLMKVADGAGAALDALGADLTQRRPPTLPEGAIEALEGQLDALPDEAMEQCEPTARVVREQLHRVCEQLAALRATIGAAPAR